MEDKMKYTNLGRTGLSVSRLCLGTMNFGPETPEEDSFAIMDRAIELGINFFDTANVYGWKRGEGITEQIVGRWLAQGGGRREQIVLATKVFGRMGGGPNDRGLSAYHIKRACEESLRRLQTDHIDLYQMHHVERETPWDEVIARGFMGLVCEQSLYNLIDRTVEMELIPACREFGLGVIAWSPLKRGILGGAFEKPKVGRRSSKHTQELVTKYEKQLKDYEAFCKQKGEKPADVALAWLLKNPDLTAPIIGPRTMEQLEGSMKALEVKLTKKDLDKLDEIWPGPGGEAPEAYAW
jgi:aryl-alcohol dehydrogenase-like predicted oxidoreductase